MVICMCFTCALHMTRCLGVCSQAALEQAGSYSVRSAVSQFEGGLGQCLRGTKAKRVRGFSQSHAVDEGLYHKMMMGVRVMIKIVTPVNTYQAVAYSGPSSKYFIYINSFCPHTNPIGSVSQFFPFDSRGHRRTERFRDFPKATELHVAEPTSRPGQCSPECMLLSTTSCTASSQWSKLRGTLCPGVWAWPPIFRAPHLQLPQH